MTERFPAPLARSCSHVSWGRCGSRCYPSPPRAPFAALCSRSSLARNPQGCCGKLVRKQLARRLGPGGEDRPEVSWVGPAAADKGWLSPAPAQGEGPRARSSSALAVLAPRSVNIRLRTGLLAFAQCRPFLCVGLGGGGEPGPAGHTARLWPRLQGPLESSML